MYRLKLKHHFDSCHKLEDYDGKCANLHGHRWEVEVVIITPTLQNGMVVDFGDIKKVIDRLDHGYLNDLVDFNPTAENISCYLQKEIRKVAKEFNKNSYIDVNVIVWESPNASITYIEDKWYSKSFNL